MTADHSPRKASVRRTMGLFGLALAFGFVWWVLNGRDLLSMTVGVPAIALAIFTVKMLGSPSLELRWVAVPKFLAFVVARSIAGSIDVAIRALKPKLDIDPSLFDYIYDFERGSVLFATIVSLLPGTLTVQNDNGQLLVHSLSSRDEAIQEIKTLELVVASLFTPVERRGAS